MARIARLVVPHSPHHVTHRGNGRRDVFLDDVDRRVYLGLARRFTSRWGVRVWSYCLMSNHVHLVLVPGSAEALARTLNMLQMAYARWFHSAHGGSGHLWGNRYYSTVVDWARTPATIRYVELNPVRAGISDDAASYAWSSARAHVNRWPNPLLDPERPLPRIIENWSLWLEEGVTAPELELIRGRTRTGRPLGDPEFVRGLEILTGRTLLPLRRGPKSNAGRPSGPATEPGTPELDEIRHSATIQ